MGEIEIQQTNMFLCSYLSLSSLSLAQVRGQLLGDAATRGGGRSAGATVLGPGNRATTDVWSTAEPPTRVRAVLPVWEERRGGACPRETVL